MAELLCQLPGRPTKHQQAAGFLRDISRNNIVRERDPRLQGRLQIRLVKVIIHVHLLVCFLALHPGEFTSKDPRRNQAGNGFHHLLREHQSRDDQALRLVIFQHSRQLPLQLQVTDGDHIVDLNRSFGILHLLAIDADQTIVDQSFVIPPGLPHRCLHPVKGDVVAVVLDVEADLQSEQLLVQRGRTVDETLGSASRAAAAPLGPRLPPPAREGSSEGASHSTQDCASSNGSRRGRRLRQTSRGRTQSRAARGAAADDGGSEGVRRRGAPACTIDPPTRRRGRHHVRLHRKSGGCRHTGRQMVRLADCETPS
mmetsp:Transcript_139359/g.445680  ORF Transcript_139359/g.445680 Transcript_139359/m.445680 type:complete len:312 (-) Transcript_139359:7-942(-)